MRRTFKSIMADYGPIALGVYLTIFAIVLTTAWLAITLGWRPESAVGSVGTFTAAYLITKVTQPLRIGATLLLTPLVGRAADRLIPSRRRAATARAVESPAELVPPVQDSPER